MPGTTAARSWERSAPAAANPKKTPSDRATPKRNRSVMRLLDLLFFPHHPAAASAHPHLVEQRFVLAPALAHLHEQAEEDLRAEEVLDLLARLAADELQHRAAAADQ